MVSYEYPVIEAKLYVVLSNGEQFLATPKDLRKFDYCQRLDAYLSFNKHLDKILREAGLLDKDNDLTSSALNPVRYLAELALLTPELLTDTVTNKNDADVVELETILQKAKKDIQN